MKKLSHQEFLDKLPKEVEYDILSTYKGMTEEILIKDKYGIIVTKPYYLLKNRPSSVKLALDKTAYTINRFKELFIDSYFYDKFVYISNSTKSTITCKIHGDFEQSADNHLKGHGCYKCNIKNNGYTRKDFISSSKNKICTLYLIKCWNEEEEFYKIGITAQSVRSRFIRGRDMPYKYMLIEQLTSNSANFIWEKEKQIKKEIRKFSYTPKIKFAGYTECFDSEEILKIIKEKLV